MVRPLNRPPPPRLPSIAEEGPAAVPRFAPGDRVMFAQSDGKVCIATVLVRRAPDGTVAYVARLPNGRQVALARDDARVLRLCDPAPGRTSVPGF